MVQEDPDGHHGCGARGHRGVHEDDVVVLDVLRQPQVVQLGLARLPPRLDQDLANSGAGFNVFLTFTFILTD